VNDALLFSKLEQHRHADSGEVLRLVKNFLLEGTTK